MAAKVKRDFHFFGAIYLQQQYYIDFFTISANMDVLSTNNDEQTIALQRLKYFFKNYLDNCLFINESEKKVIDIFTNLNVRISTLPSEPVDQAIAIVLLHKMSAITEGRIFVNNLTLKSQSSEGIEYIVDAQQSYGNFDVKNNNHWWHESTLNISNKKTLKKEKIVQLQKNGSDWVDLGLGWKKTIKPENQIIFTLDTEKH